MEERKYADIFGKCEKYTLANEFRAKGIYPYFHALESRQAPEVMMEGKRRIMLGSNNYLGLTENPEIIRAGLDALKEYGTGCSGGRLSAAHQLHGQPHRGVDRRGSGRDHRRSGGGMT